jgi:purine-binding chemotaxis protein CheW
MTRAVLLPVERDWFALPMHTLQEVVAEPMVTPVPAAPATLRGLFNVRGQIVPLLDTAALLGLGRMTVAPFAAVVQTADGPAGLATSGVPEPAELGRRIGPADCRGAVATYAAGDRIATLLDPAVLLAPNGTGAAT